MSKEDLIPLNQRTPEERTEIARKGQAASVKARNEKKIISETYFKALAKLETDVEMSGEDIIINVLKRCDHSSVSMLKEMREATEGTKINFNDVSEGRLKLVDYMSAEDVDSVAKQIDITGKNKS